MSHGTSRSAIESSAAVPPVFNETGSLGEPSSARPVLPPVDQASAQPDAGGSSPHALRSFRSWYPGRRHVDPNAGLNDVAEADREADALASPEAESDSAHELSQLQEARRDRRRAGFGG